MIQFFLIALLVMAVITAGAILAAVLQGKRAKKAEKENAALHDAFWQVAEKAERLQKTLGVTAKVEGDADAKRQELAQAPDSDLVDRANGLFGVPDDKERLGRAGAKDAGGNSAAGTGSSGDGAGSL